MSPAEAIREAGKYTKPTLIGAGGGLGGSSLIALFMWLQIGDMPKQQNETNARLVAIETQIGAIKEGANDRWTGSQHAEYSKMVNALISELRSKADRNEERIDRMEDKFDELRGWGQKP